MLWRWCATSARRCPWDRAQTRETLRPYLVEEVLELDHALGEGDARRDPGRAERPAAPPGLSARASPRSAASSPPTTSPTSSRPRCGGAIPTSSTSATAEPWERIKRRERRGRTLAGIVPTLPAAAHGLSAAGARGLGGIRLARRQRAAGKDAGGAGGGGGRSWHAGTRPPRPEPAIPIRQRAAPSDALIDEIGDLLFAVVNLARKAGVQPGSALDRANRKFRQRFEADRAAGRGARDRDRRGRAGGAGSAVGRGEGDGGAQVTRRRLRDTAGGSAAETRSPPGCAGCPQIQATVRSRPRPKPECTNVPYFRRSRYQRYASGSRPCFLDAGQQLVVVVLALRAADDLAVALRAPGSRCSARCADRRDSPSCRTPSPPWDS